MTKCENCGKDTPEPYLNYCDWACHVEDAKKAGGKVIAPNGLPITCIMADGTMMENEDADHPDYKFPIEAKFHKTPQELFDEGDCCWVDGNGDKTPMTLEELERECIQVHALIYTDGSIALSIYEKCYAMWRVKSGEVLCGTHLWDKEGAWILTSESLEKIKELAREQRR